MSGTPAPRLLITDTLGQRIVPIDKPLVTLGRRSETDVRIPGAGVSRLHAEISLESGVCRIKDLESKFGTFINGQRASEHTLAHGDEISLGQSDDTKIIFLVGDEAPSVDRSAAAAVNELRHMAGLLEGLRALGSGRVLDDVLALVLDSAIEVTGAERGFIMLAPDGGELEFKLARGVGRVTLPGRTFATSRKIPETVFKTGHDTIVDDLLDEGMAAMHMGTVALGIRCVLCTPLRLVRYVERTDEASDEKMIGVLYLDSRERGALRAASTRTALETLSTEAAIAIENARLYRQALERAKYEQELKVAAAIQQALLPNGARNGGFFTTAASSLPCRSVGGDFFDYVDLPAGQFGFILGDVAGKGAASALLAAALLGMFSAEAVYHTSSSALISRMNAGLFRRSIEARFLTTFYALISKDGSMTYTNAGHNPPILVGVDGTRRLERGGVVLGLFDHATFEEETLTIKPGDTVVIFSDGVTEAFNSAGEEFGDDRLVRVVEGHREKSPDALLDALVGEVRAFCGDAPQSDDLTMMVVRYNG
jgi:serine phosphatase RsbU (regulator of sigma subunit)/pSer/pThr/pTyr-binding forkhead associated (FHA) protein